MARGEVMKLQGCDPYGIRRKKKSCGFFFAALAAFLSIISCFAKAQDSAPAPAPGTRTGFTVNVQVITKSEFAGYGVGVQHQRSYNNEHGIDIPVTIHPDGTFEGTGSGSDRGTADIVAGGVSGDSQFGNNLSIIASGTVSPEDCSAVPCLPGTMHLVLSGVASTQSTVAHVRAGSMQKTVATVDPGGSGTIILDLPAQVGSAVEQVLFSNSLTTSMLIVTIAGETLAPPNDPDKPPTPQRPPGFPLGNSDSGGGGGGGSGGGGAGGGSGGGSGGGGGGGATGIVVPGTEGGNRPSVVVIRINETIHAADAMPSTQGNHVAITLNESVHVSATVSQPAVISVAETVHVGDAVVPSASIAIAETVHVTDTAASHP